MWRHMGSNPSPLDPRLNVRIACAVGYIPFDPQAANLMFMLVSSR